MRHFLRYSAVGAVGFLADASCFFVLVHGVRLPWEAARLLAFLFAVSVTWVGNRHFTFASRSPATTEGLRYLAVQTAGCFVNYLAFAAWIHIAGADRLLAAPYLFGTAAALAFNYSMARCFVFRPG